MFFILFPPTLRVLPAIPKTFKTFEILRLNLKCPENLLTCFKQFSCVWWKTGVQIFFLSCPLIYLFIYLLICFQFSNMLYQRDCLKTEYLFLPSTEFLSTGFILSNLHANQLDQFFDSLDNQCAAEERKCFVFLLL